MNRYPLKYYCQILVLVFLLGNGFAGYATNYTSVSSGNWSNSATWSPAGIPGLGDAITIEDGHTITYTGSLLWANGTITIDGSGKLLVTGSFTSAGGTLIFSSGSEFRIGGGLMVDWSRNCTVGGDLVVNGDLDNRGILNVGGNLTCEDGGILNESTRQISVGGDLTASTDITNDGIFDVTGHVVVSNGYFTNGQSHSFTIGGSLTASGTITNQGTLTIATDCISTGGQINNEWTRDLTIGGSMSANTGIANAGTMEIPGNMVITNGTLTNENPDHLIHVGLNVTVTGDITNKGILDIDGNLSMPSGNLSLIDFAIVAVNGNFTKTGNVNVDNSDLIIGGSFISNGGSTTINQWNGDFYVFQALTANGTQAGCNAGCFPNDICTSCAIQSGPQWVADGRPGYSYISFISTPSWWEDHLAHVGESDGPFIACPSSAMNFKVDAVTTDVGTLSSNTFEWAVYGGTITGFNGTSISAQSATVEGHAASYQSVYGIVGTTEYSLDVLWESATFTGAYVAVRQTSAYGCSDGTWSVYYINIQEVAAPTGSVTQSFCANLNPTVAALAASGSSIHWYSSPTGGTALALGALLGNGYYYASQTANGCESTARLEVLVTLVTDRLWTGNINTDWNESGNWFCGLIPTLTTDVHIPNVSNQPVLSGGPVGSCKNILVDNGSSLTVIGNTLQIAGTITNTGIFTASAGTIEMKGSGAQLIGSDVFAGNTIMDLTINNASGVTLQGLLNVSGIVKVQSGNLSSDGYLTLLSTSAQTALIDGAGAGEILGDVTMQRYIASAFGYKYFSSPFGDATVSEFGQEINLAATFPTFYGYNEYHLSPTNTDISGWTVYTTPADLLQPLRGYAANFGPVLHEETVEVTGVVNNGYLELDLWNHNSTYTLGFDLVGNPYPSPIDWYALSGWTKNNIDDAIYFFKAGNTYQYTGTYSSYINGVSNDGSSNNIIPSMQGFFVHITDGTYPVSAKIGLTNSVRIVDLHPSFKNEILDDRPILRFAATIEGKNALEDVAVVYFDNNATQRFDKEMDALKMTNTDLIVPNIYTLSTDPKQLSINGMPFPSDSITQIPLGFTVLSDGWIIFNAKDISRLPSDLHIYLADSETNITQDLEQLPVYRVNLKAGQYDKRFSLVFSLAEIKGPGEITGKMFSLSRSVDVLQLNVALPFNTRGNLLITDMAGQILMRKDVFDKETIEISPYVSSGIYIISLISGQRVQSEKVLMRTDYE